MGTGSISTTYTAQNTEWFSRSGSVRRSELDTQIKTNQKDINLLERLVKEVSTVQNKKGGGFLRFYEDKGGLYFSPNRSIREMVGLRDGGASEAPKYIKDFDLAKFGKKIKCVTIQKNLRNCLEQHRKSNEHLKSELTALIATESKKQTSNDSLNSQNTISPQTSLAPNDSPPLKSSVPPQKPPRKDVDRSLSPPTDSPKQTADLAQSKPFLMRSLSSPAQNTQAELVQSVLSRSNSSPILKGPGERESYKLFEYEQNTLKRQNDMPSPLVKRSDSEAGTSSTPSRPPRKIDSQNDLKRSQSDTIVNKTEITKTYVSQMTKFWEEKFKSESSDPLNTR